jgi:tetratricopeptide (TPR) repeat protein
VGECPEAGLLLCYAAGQLDGDELERIDDHVDGCRACGELVAAVARSAAGSTPLTVGANPVGDGTRCDCPESTEPGEPAPLPTVVGRYVVLGELGRGGMGTVVEAWDPKLQRRVAVKLIRRERGVDARRLRSEARALAALAHPHVVGVFETGTLGPDDAAGPVFLVMEIVDGLTLDRWCAASGRSAPEIVAAYVAAGEGLAAAHAVGIVHRDFKPTNVLVGDDGRVRVTDFGLARPTCDTAASASDSISSAVVTASASFPVLDTERLTRPGMVTGTPGYMAPEQRRGEEVDARADQYSFCVSLLESLVGRHPDKATGTAPIPIPRRARRALDRGLDPDPRRRWPDMAALLRELSAPARPWRAAAGLVAVAGLAAGVWWTWPAPATVEAGHECGAQTDRSAEIWDDARRDRVATRMGAAADVADVVDTLDALDNWMANWRDHHDAGCRAARDRSVDDCMALGLAGFDAAVAVLEDSAGADEGRGIVRGLPDPARCVPGDDVDASVDPSQRRAVAAVRADLARAKTLRLAIQLPEAMALADASRTRAKSIGHPPLLAAVELERGWVLYELGQSAQASEAMRRAHEQGAGHGADEIAAESATVRAYILGHAADDIDGAFAWLRHAEAAIDRMPPGQRGEILPLFASARGQLLELTGRLPEAIADFERALAAIEQTRGPDDSLMVLKLCDLGDALAESDPDAALAYYARAERIARASYGDDHPEVGLVMLEVGALHEHHGRPDVALPYFQRALESFEGTYGPMHQMVGDAAFNLGVVHDDLGDDLAARAWYRRAAEIWTASYGPHHHRTAFPIVSQAWLAFEVGDLDEAEVQYQRALVIYEQGLGPDHPECATPLSGLAEVEILRGQGTRAVAYAERALQITSDRAPADLANRRLRLARALRVAAREDAARTQARLAGELLADAPTADEEVVELTTQIDAFLAAERA